jgi:hypothetical protein
VQGLGLPVELLQLGGQQARLRLQRTGRGGGPGLAPAAVEQLQVQLGLQLGNGHADGRRHAPQLARGGGKRAAVQHGQKQRDLVGGKAMPGNLSVNLKEADFFFNFQNIHCAACRNPSLRWHPQVLSLPLPLLRLFLP